MSAQELLELVARSAAIVVRAGQPFGGLFPSLLDRETGAMLETLPPAIPGQRDGDRAHLGCNLMHDHPLLATLYGLAETLGRDDLASAADQYLRHWAAECTDTVTGLFPWGEHAYWHLKDNTVGNSYLLRTNGRPSGGAIHDHLQQAPVWLWEKLYQLNPYCVERFAEGLEYHWKEGEPAEYIRHATIEACRRPERGLRSADFPRHSGFYMLDWTIAYQKTGKTQFLDEVEKALDYWWVKRDARGLLLIESRSAADDTQFFNKNAPAQTLSLATSLLDAAVLMDAGSARRLAETMRERAATYVDGFLAAPHDLAAGVFVDESDRTTNAMCHQMPIWGSRYGEWPVARAGLLASGVYRNTDDARLLVWAEAAGRWCVETPFPANVTVPAMDGGLSLELLADLYDLTGDRRWRDDGVTLAMRLADVYLDGGPSILPRGAAGIDWYESQLGTAYLFHGLTRLVMLAMDESHCALEADYTAR